LKLKFFFYHGMKGKFIEFMETGYEQSTTVPTSVEAPTGGGF